MTILQAIVYGVVQGITEWLPISSTAHLKVVPTLLGWPDPGAGFTAVIQLGTVMAVLLYFWADLRKAFSGWARSLRGVEKDSLDARMGWAVFYGTIPIVVIGYLLKDQIKGEFRSLYIMATSLIVMGCLMYLAERYGRARREREASGSGQTKAKEVTVRDGIIVGLWQCCSLIPGMSRSGSTITGALFAGFDPSTAARFSFLLSVPAITAAGIYELIQERKYLEGGNLAPTLVATFVSFAVGYASIAFLIKYLQRHGTAVFVGYRIALGILLLVLLQMGRLSP